MNNTKFEFDNAEKYPLESDEEPLPYAKFKPSAPSETDQKETEFKSSSNKMMSE
jgi:hypothetical protein